MGLSDHRTFVVADIPGIIEGAHQGKGLGFRFLQHVERTRVLAFLVPLDQENPQAVYDRLRQEVRQYSEELAHKTHVVVLTKLDLRKSQELVPELTTEGAAGVLAISSATGQGVEDLKNYLWQLVQQAKAAEPAEQGGSWQDEDVLR